MKKILSAALAALMVSSSVLCAGFTASAAEEAAVRPQYATTTALRHEGGFAWVEMMGKNSKNAERLECLFTYKAEDEYDEDAIVLDGEVTEEEWGSPTLMLDPEYMAREKGNVPTADNTFYWSRKVGEQKYIAPMTAKVWFRWDEAYMYIAAVVTDVDGQLNIQNGENTWDGDALQFRIDPLGPNSGVPEGEKYVARPQEYVDGKLEYVYKQPWANTIVKNPVGAAIESYSAVGNFAVAFTTNPSKGKLGMCSIYDMGKRYDPTVEPVTESDGTPVLDENGQQKYETVYKSHDMYPGTGNPYGDTYASVKSYNNNKDTTYKQRIDTHYEIAIPWTQVGENFVPTVGHELGMAFGVINGGTGGEYNNSWFSWGSGMFGKQIADGADTCGGSNCVILSDEDEFSLKCDHTEWNYPTCEEGYVCAGCGKLERGFIAGHVYEFTNGASPTATTEGGMHCHCTVCGDDKDIVIPAKPAKWLVGYNQDSTKIPSEIDCYDVKFYNSRNPDDKTPLIDASGNPLTSLTQTYDGFKVIDGTYPGIGTYFQTSRISEIYNKNKGDDSKFDNSFAISYDFNIQKDGLGAYNQPWTDEKGEPDPTDTHYRNGIWQWFGGKNGLKFKAGYFSAEDKVIIMEYYGDNIEEGSYHAIAESEKLGIGLNEWHKMRFEYDSDHQSVFMYMDDELVTYAWNEDFTMGNVEDLSSIHRLMDLSVYFKDVEITTMSYGHGSDVPGPVEYTVTIDGVAQTVAPGETVTLTAPGVTKVDNETYYRFYQWIVNSGDVTIDGDSFVMPESDVEIVADTVVIGDVGSPENGEPDGKISNFDALLIKRAICGLDVLEGKALSAADIDADGKVNANDIAKFLRLALGDGSYVPAK